MPWSSSIPPRTSKSWLSFCWDFRVLHRYDLLFMLIIIVGAGVEKYSSSSTLQVVSPCIGRLMSGRIYQNHGYSKITWRLFNSFPRPNLLGWLLQCDDVRLPWTVGQADRPCGAHVPAPARPEHLLQRGEAFPRLFFSFSEAFLGEFWLSNRFPMAFLWHPLSFPLAFNQAHLWLFSTPSFLQAFLWLSSCMLVFWLFRLRLLLGFIVGIISLFFSYIKGTVLHAAVVSSFCHGKIDVALSSCSRNTLFIKLINNFTGQQDH